MALVPRRREQGGSRLFASYALGSLVPVVVLGLVLVQGYQQEALDRGLGQGRSQAAVIEEMAIAPALGRNELGTGLNQPERERLQQATDLALFSGSVVRIRVRSFAGVVVFSDDGSSGAALPATDIAFRTAALGGTDVAIVGDPGKGKAQLIRVLQPIIPNATGEATGVLELYLPYAPIAVKVRAQLHRTYLRLAAGLAGLYFVLALITWSTTRRLRRHAAQRNHAALHDSLTGLPNREWFRIRADEAGSAGERGAIVLMDLDRFKEVNDTLGHHAGDELLCTIGKRLSESLRTDDTVCRLGGDEFGLILPGLAGPGEALELLTRVRDEMSAEVAIEGVTLSMEASFGVAFYPKHGTGVEELLRRADSAMYQGKRGTAGIVCYESESAPESTQWLVLQGELRRALDRDELMLHYQPKIDLRTGLACGVEALLRWQHPQRGLLPPGEFLAALEHSGLIEPVTAWVIRQALHDHSCWVTRGAQWQVSVNISARNLEAPDFPAFVVRQLAEAGVPAEELCLEVTETALAADAAVAARAITTLAATGIHVSVDDFGMGYTSISQLRTIPVSEVKIDREFIKGLEHSEQDRAIVRSVIELVHGLGASVTAEGVETAETADWLTKAACDAAQGYHYARPVPWQELLERFGTPAPRALIPVTR